MYTVCILLGYCLGTANSHTHTPLSLLSTAEQKAEAAFALYDFNGDGFISLEEMTRYLASVFNVMYATQAGVAAQMGVPSEELARVTAIEAFAEADVNHDGKLSYEEFTAWYSANNEDSDDSDPETTSAEESSLSWVSLPEVRRLTHLEKHGVEEVFEEFAVAADDEGLLDEESFQQCFRTWSLVFVPPLCAVCYWKSNRGCIDLFIVVVLDLFWTCRSISPTRLWLLCQAPSLNATVGTTPKKITTRPTC